MPEVNTIRGCLQTFGMDCAITRNFITGPTVGLDQAITFIEMSDDSLKEVMKQVVEASKDAATYGNDVANRPKPNVHTKNALSCFTFALKYLYQ